MFVFGLAFLALFSAMSMVLGTEDPRRNADPSDELFYREADAVVQWRGNARLSVRADESTHAAFLDRLRASLSRGGWTTQERPR